MLSGHTLRAEQSLSSRRNLLLFLIPSLLGILLFMTPIPTEDGVTILVAILASALKGWLAPVFAPLLVVVLVTSGVLSVLARALQPAWLNSKPFLKHLMMPSWPWAIVRLVGALFVTMIYFKVGPEQIISENTGTLLFNDFLPSLFSVFIFAGFFLPLLLNFGLLEFVSSLLTPIMRPAFKLPGRSAIDCGASWLGDGTVGILLTTKQYEQKFYTQREAAVIGTTFSLVSISFTIYIVEQVNLSHMIFPFYATICVAGLFAALVMPRIPPLSLKKDLLIDGSEPCPRRDDVPEGHTMLSYGYHQALAKTQAIKNPVLEMTNGLKNAAEMIFGLLPVVLAIGTVALILAEETSLFDWLGAPFLPLLELMQVPEAAEAARTMVVGFADMFLPAILATDIQSDMTRFIIAALSVTQLIYMSEVGALLLGSKLPVNLFEIIVIFLLRTLLTLPVIVGMAHFFF